MLLVAHYLAPSPVHGIGVYTREIVAEGMRVWTANPVIDREITFAELAELPRHVIEYIRNHGEFLPATNRLRLSADGDSFMNHADEPNLIVRGDEMFAGRDIAAGEELFCDYRDTPVLAFDPEALEQDAAVLAYRS